jgi:F-type H+-transporting ATPase subunit b
MLIDWFTVVAQALNFLVLAWLLKHFLYHPILNAIDVREKRIAAELADADAKKMEARKERDEFKEKNKVFDEHRSALLVKVNDEAKAERERLLEEARLASDALRQRQQEALEVDARNLNQAICRRTQQEVFSIARNALSDLATTSLEERLAEVFIRRLGEMDGGMQKTLSEAISTSSDPAVVRSAFDLLPEQQAAIRKALDETFARDISVLFETAPALISGIELTAGGQKVGWTIASYLASLKKNVDELINQPTPSAAPLAIKTIAVPVAKSS